MPKIILGLDSKTLMIFGGGEPLVSAEQRLPQKLKTSHFFAGKSVVIA
jgi:hypothetical protein